MKELEKNHQSFWLLSLAVITYWIDTIEDHITQIRRSCLGDSTILSNFHIKTSSLWSVSDYKCHLIVFCWFVTCFDYWLPFWYLFFHNIHDHACCVFTRIFLTFSWNRLGLLTMKCVSITKQKKANLLNIVNIM